MLAIAPRSSRPTFENVSLVERLTYDTWEDEQREVTHYGWYWHCNKTCFWKYRTKLLFVILDKVDKCHIKTDCTKSSSNYYITVAKMKTKTKHINNNNKKKQQHTTQEISELQVKLEKKEHTVFFFIYFIPAWSQDYCSSSTEGSTLGHFNSVINYKPQKQLSSFCSWTNYRSHKCFTLLSVREDESLFICLLNGPVRFLTS